MAEKKSPIVPPVIQPTPTKPTHIELGKEDGDGPSPVDIISSIPIDVQFSPESLAALNSQVEKPSEPVTAASNPVTTAPETVTPPTASPPAAGTPVNMTVLQHPPIQPNVIKGEGATLAPTTTEADDLVTQGQRDINKIWEHTQSYIAMGVTASTILIIGVTVTIAMITDHDISQATATQINYLVVMTTLILSFYFSRTNHAAIGGVGAKPNEPYTGR